MIPYGNSRASTASRWRLCSLLHPPGSLVVSGFTSPSPRASSSNVDLSWGLSKAAVEQLTAAKTLCSLFSLARCQYGEVFEDMTQLRNFKSDYNEGLLSWKHPVLTPRRR